MVNENQIFSPASPEEEKKISIIGLVRGTEGLVIKKFNGQDNEEKSPNEITVSFDEIKNLVAREEELSKEEIEVIVKFFKEKKYIIEASEEEKEFKIKMPEELSQKGY